MVEGRRRGVRRDGSRRRLIGARALGLGLALLVVAGCSGMPDIEPWRARTAVARPEAERGSLPAEIEEVEKLRGGLELERSRQLALTLVAENPEDPIALRIASRAESDQVFLLPEREKEQRNLAAASSLEYARRAVDAGEADVETQAQLAWALGTTTHLQPMFERSAHARETLEAVEAALDLDGDNPTALATLSVLHLRLATLPWIANLFAWGAPDGDLERAIEAASRCVELVPSVENRVILAKALLAAERLEEAEVVLREALASPDTHPRDPALRPQAAELLLSLEERSNAGRP